MISARGGAALLVIIGLVAGTAADPSGVRETHRADGYWVLAADFHVHAFPGDGVLTPWALGREARRRGLDVITITNHNQTLAARLARRASRLEDGPMVLIGEEITGRNYHLSAAGLQRGVDWDQSATEAIEDVHAQGGVAIAAHPVRAFWEGFDDGAVTLLDGFEAAHPGMHVDDQFKSELQAFGERARALNPGIAPIGSSDFHGMPSPGLCRTYVLASEPTEAGVIDAVRSGRTVAADRDGHLVGDPGFIRAVQARRDRVEPSAAANLTRRGSVACTWLGLLGLVLFGPARRQ